MTQVLLSTSFGEIVISLDEEKAPVTTANFLQYVDSGFYTDTVFHRVIPGFMVQGGGLTRDLRKKDTRDPIQNEASNGLKNRRGTVAMARTSAPHSATAQFFVNHSDNGFLDPGSDVGYAVFGEVTQEWTWSIRSRACGPRGRRGWRTSRSSRSSSSPRSASTSSRHAVHRPGRPCGAPADTPGAVSRWSGPSGSGRRRRASSGTPRPRRPAVRSRSSRGCRAGH